MARYNPDAKRLGSQAAALQRVAKNYPDEYKKVIALRDACSLLYKLPVSKFDKLLVTSLQELVKEGICKKPISISFNQR